MQSLEITLYGSWRGKRELSHHFKARKASTQQISNPRMLSDTECHAPGNRLIRPAAQNTGDTPFGQHSGGHGQGLVLRRSRYVISLQPRHGHAITLP